MALFAGLSDTELYRIRQEEAMPLLDEFRLWLIELEKATPPKGLLGKAIGYTLNQWAKSAIIYLTAISYFMTAS
jgi:hypothetical protein